MEKQLSLFLDCDLERHRLIAALESLDIEKAGALADEFQRLWPDSQLTWELAALRFAEGAKTPPDLDAAFVQWHKFTETADFSTIPESIRAAIRTKLFSRALGARQLLPGLQYNRTKKGRSLGDFYLLADQPNNARRSFERERSDYGDSWKLRLQIGNCYSRVGNDWGAFSNYRWAFFQGLPAEHFVEIENQKFRTWLREADDEWVFAEVLLRREMPPMRFVSRVQFEEFSSQFPADERTSEEWQFSRWYVISENSVYAGEALKLTARKHLKRLNRRLHKRYMDSL